MKQTTCPRCGRELAGNAPLYQCCRCFTVYCRNCKDTNEGRNCPQCRMGPRLILSTAK